MEETAKVAIMANKLKTNSNSSMVKPRCFKPTMRCISIPLNMTPQK
jgi:hypothetical protein